MAAACRVGVPFSVRSREKLIDCAGTYVNDLVAKMRKLCLNKPARTLTEQGNPDKDFRYMALNDLLGEVQKSNNPYDDQVTSRLLDGVLKTLEDKNGEVQNMGVKCLGPLVRRGKEAHVQVVIDRLCRSGSNEELKDISSTALRTVILEVSPTSSVALSITRRLVPKLLLQLKDSSSSSDVLLDSIDVLIELLNRFGQTVSSLSQEVQTDLVHCLTALLDNPRPAVRKRAVVALGILAVHIPLDAFASFMSEMIQMLTITKTNEKLKVLLSLMGQICKSEIGHAGHGRFGDYLQTIAPFVFDSLNLDDDEIKEISLQSLEVFELQAGAQISKYDTQILEIITRLLKYDPNYDDETMNGEDEDMDDADDTSDLGSDFEDDGEYDDDDDISWKVRRCAAKLAAALVTTRPEVLDSACTQLGSAFIARFNEREENVRVEVLQTFSVLIASVNATSPRSASPSRKRPRDHDEMEVEPTMSGRRTIAQLVPRIAKGLAKQLDGKSLAAKQVCFDILRELSRDPESGIDSHLSVLLPATRTALTSTVTSNNASTTSNLKISALEFLDVLLSMSTPSINAQLDAIAPLIIQPLLQDKLNKISLVAVGAAERLLKCAAVNHNTSVYNQVCQALFEKSKISDLEQEVRDQLIRAIGECISIAPYGAEVQGTACTILAEKLKVEATRLVAIVAIGQAAGASTTVDHAWCKAMIGQILAYTTNVNKVLRSAAVSSSIRLAERSSEHLSAADVERLAMTIIGLLESDDTQLVPNVVHWLSALAQNVQRAEQRIICEATLPVISKHIKSNDLQPIGPVLHYLNIYFKACSSSLGSSAIVTALSTDSLSSGNLSALAKFIGVAIIQDGNAAQIQQYIKDIRAPKESEEAKTLALYVIGECGQNNALDEEAASLVLGQFSSPSEKVKAAAGFAFGNIVSGNLDTYLPLLLEKLDKGQEDRYLLAVSLKELISKPGDSDRSHKLIARAEDIWQRLFELSSEDRAKNILAECIGRLTLMKPQQLLPELRKQIKSASTTTRAVVIRAVRYTFTAASDGFDDQLRPFVVDFLSLMEDQDLEIRRLALSTLYSAAHNKPHLIQDHLTRLLPLLYQETVILPELVHTVQMGPFKHIVDDGLELRKSAFETLHALLDSSFNGMDLERVFEIVVRGLGDVNEIRTLCFLVIIFLASAVPSETATRLDAITEMLQKIMGTKLKESAVKQDKERDDEVKKSTLRCVASLMPLANDSTPGFNLFLDEIKNTRPKELSDAMHSGSSSAIATTGASKMEL